MRESSYPNYNVRVSAELREGVEWCRAHGFEVRVFENFDGGGFNFYIFEFQLVEHALEFAKYFGSGGVRGIWIEDQNQETHYIGEAVT